MGGGRTGDGAGAGYKTTQDGIVSGLLSPLDHRQPQTVLLAPPIMARTVILSLVAACLLGGGMVPTVSARPPSLNHPDPPVNAGLRPLFGFTDIQKSDNPHGDMPSLFRRQADPPGTGALLCPTGICADDRLVAGQPCLDSMLLQFPPC